MTKLKVTLILGLGLLAVIVLGMYWYRPIPPAPAALPAVMHCPQLTSLASASNSAVSTQAQKLDLLIKKSEASGDAAFSSQVEQQAQQAFQTIPEKFMACHLILQASLCASEKNPELGFKFAEMCLEVCPSTSRE